MKILILNWRDIKNPSSGGAEILTHEIAKRCVKWGHTVVQVSSFFPSGKKEEMVDGVKIIRCGSANIRSFHLPIHLAAFWWYLTKRKEKFDVIIDEIHGLPFFTPWYVKEKKAVLICEVAGELWKKMFGPIFGSLGRIVEKFYLSIVYSNIPFLTISQSTKEDLIKNGIKEKNITVLPMGISIPDDLRIFKKEKEQTLIFVGRLSKQKGIEDAIFALREVIKKIPRVKLWVIGREDKEYLNYLKDLSRKLGINDKIRFFGFVSEVKKFELMSKAHILLAPSIKEGWGLTVIEAGSQGTPTIAYNTSGLRDSIQNHKTGLLVDNRQPDELAEKILMLCRNRLLYQKLSENARKWSRNFNWEKSARQSLVLIEQVSKVKSL